MAVVKANAYGHGLREVVGVITAADPGVDALAVARLDEAIELRNVGLAAPITVLSGSLDSAWVTCKCPY